MVLNKVLTSYTFRFMSMYVAVLSVVVLVVMLSAYALFSFYYFTQLRDVIDGEMEQLEQAFELGGATKVHDFIEHKSERGELNGLYYLVIDQQYDKVVGNLDVWPKHLHYNESWVSFQRNLLRLGQTGVEIGYIARARPLNNGYQLLVARHYYDIIANANLVGGALMGGMIVTIVLGTIGGALVARSSIKQVDAINRTLQRIMTGDLSERINTDAHPGDTEKLTVNINRMLDRIQMLMEGVRQVSDNIAHDLRTPLSRLRNQLADLHIQLGGENEETVQQLIDEADGLLLTFSALLRIAHIESGSRRAGFKDLDPKIILLDVIDLYEPLAADKSITLGSALQDGSLMEGDRDLLFQAFANVLDNAIKYTPAGGRIEVLLEKAAAQIRVVVTDSGDGIPDIDRGKVFRRFFRVENCRSSQPGNGLGLSLVWAVVKLHEGDIILGDNVPGLKVEMVLPLKLNSSVQRA